MKNTLRTLGVKETTLLGINFGVVIIFLAILYMVHVCGGTAIYTSGFFLLPKREFVMYILNSPISLPWKGKCAPITFIQNVLH
jgi:hypothetical protein